MPATPTLTSHRPSTDEVFDAETLALLEAIEVPLPDFADLDLDIAFGTPLELHEPFATSREKGLPEGELLEQFFARRHAARDILADDPTITARVRECLVDVLLPCADRLRRTIRSGCRPEYAAA
ncbi:hypothetical protein [Streptomyces sp. NPDC048106]|uniref:hypothetical protein n=1 Tax=Streptomyces sp. NPDC048106 TaxID=3155750 RepID=UPI0034573011